MSPDTQASQSPMPPTERIYRVIFHHQGNVYEMYARGVGQGELYGFIEVEEYVFGERSKLVIDPGEDRLRTEFEGVRRSYIPMHAVLRIDEVEKEGEARITDSKGEKVMPFPVPVPRK